MTNLRSFDIDEVRRRWDEARAGTLVTDTSGNPMRIYALPGDTVEGLVHGARALTVADKWYAFACSPDELRMAPEKPREFEVHMVIITRDGVVPGCAADCPAVIPDWSAGKQWKIILCEDGSVRKAE